MTEEQLSKAESIQIDIRNFKHFLKHSDKEVTFFTMNHHSISDNMMQTDIAKKYNALFKKFFEEQIKRLETEFSKL